jgi:oxaloacetate decarboxylase alpha subunit
VGAQAFENVVSGKRYEKMTDESIKYLLGYYGEPAFPLDPALMDRVMSLPRAQELLDWTPEGYLKTIEELRQEIGPDLSDDDLLLKILIPGARLEWGGAKKQAPAATAPSALPADAHPAGPVSLEAAGLPKSFSVDVDGEVFRVTVSPIVEGQGNAVTAEAVQAPAASREPPEGAILCGRPGLVLSIQVKVGDPVAEGQEVATIETMKMRSYIVSPKQGVVAEVWAQEGQMVAAEDVLMVIS